MIVSRRRFCQSTLAATMAGAFSGACSRAESLRAARRVPGEIGAVTLDGQPSAIEGAAVGELAEQLEGLLLWPGESGYDGARRIWNGMHDRHPALIVRPRSASDVAHAVTRPAFDGVGPASYLTMQTRMDGIARPGIRSYIKSGMVAAFTPGLIDAMLEAFTPGRGVIINSFATGGVIADVDETATAWPHRNAQAMVAALSFWPDQRLDDDRIGTIRDLWAALEPHTGGYYANIQADDIDVESNYGPAFGRLVSIKQQYDPLNLFRLNSNISTAP